METSLSNKLQDEASGSTTNSQEISVSLLQDMTLQLSKLRLEESVKQHESLAVDKVETTLSSKLVESATSQQFSESVVLLPEASLKRRDPPPTASIKRRATVESSSPIVSLKRKNQDTHSSPVKESLEKSSSLVQPLLGHSVTDAELESPLKFIFPRGVPTKRRTPKFTKKLESITCSSMERKDNSAQMVDMVVSGSAPKEEGNDVAVQSVEEMGLGKDESRPLSRKGKEKVVSESLDEIRPLSRRGKEKVVRFDDQPFIIGGDVDELKEMPYNLRKRKPKQSDFEKAVTKVAVEVKEKPKGSRNKQKKKEASRYVFTLTEEEIAEDLRAMNSSKHSRPKRRRPVEIQREIDKLCPRLEFIVKPR